MSIKTENQIKFHSIIQMVNVLPYNAVERICSEYEIGYSTKFFKTVPLIKRCFVDDSVLISTTKEYKLYIDSGRQRA